MMLRRWDRMVKYEDMTDEEIDKRLREIPEEEWYNHPELIKEGIMRFLRLCYGKKKS